jgi:hypothetical protein
MRKPDLTDRVRVPERVAFRRVEKEMALIDVDTGIYFGLDETGARIWELLAENGSLRVVLERMAEEYDATPSRLEVDLLRLIEELATEGLIEFV